MAQQLRRGVGRRPLARAVAACCAATALGCLMWSIAYLLRNAVQLGGVSSAGFFSSLRPGGRYVGSCRVSPPMAVETELRLHHEVSLSWDNTSSVVSTRMGIMTWRNCVAQHVPLT